MNYKIFLILITIFKLTNEGNAQVFDEEKNKILYQKHLNHFYKKIEENESEVKVLHLGDSHIMIGHFSNEIRRLFDSAIGIKSYGWVFPNQIGRFNTFYTNSKTVTGKTTFINNLQKEGKYLNGIAGQSIQFQNAKTEIEFSLKNLPDSLMYFNKLKILYQTDTTTTVLLTAYDSSNKSLIKTDKFASLSTTTKNFPNNQKISEYNLNRYYNKLKLSVDKNDSTKQFNLLGIYLENTNKSGMIYNSLGVGGSSLYSITNNNSLLLSDIIIYKPDLIILSFGSNDAYSKTFDTVKYKSKLENFIDSIVNKQPNISILITAPPDSRSKNREPVSIEKIQEVFLRIAETHPNVAFWDLRSIMGGKNSVLRWLNLKLAATDKLHYTKAGYELQAQLLIKALLNN
jgi:lysophospholipase L1-like esterase